MDNELNEFLETLYKKLPLHAEEGGEFTVLPLDDLFNSLNEQENNNLRIIINIIQRLYLTVGILDEVYAQNNQWRFKSYPASLLGRSMLASLIDTKQSFFSSGFWLTQDAYSPVLEEQRRILREVETRRSNFNAQSAKPVRFIHVAWALIIIDDQILLRHREDKGRPGLNNYVLVGGRMSQQDLRDVGIENPLSLLQSPDAFDNQAAIEVALRREVKEETRLEHDHYDFSFCRDVGPYTIVEGAGANHALTEYRIRIFQINLSQNGYFHLLSNIVEDQSLTWFKLDEFSQRKTADGKMAFIDALVESFKSEKEWFGFVKSLNSSFHNENSYIGEPVTIPAEAKGHFMKGKTGKEKSVEITLSDDDVGFIAALILIGRGQEPIEKVEGVKILHGGWVNITAEPFNILVSQLSKKLALAGVPILEGVHESYFRVSAAPEQIFLNESVFQYQLKAEKLTIIRNEIITPIGVFSQAKSNALHLSTNLFKELNRLSKGNEPTRYAPEDLTKIVRRDIKPECISIGLRSYLRTQNKEFHITISEKNKN